MGLNELSDADFRKACARAAASAVKAAHQRKHDDKRAYCAAAARLAACGPNTAEANRRRQMSRERDNEYAAWQVEHGMIGYRGTEDAARRMVVMREERRKRKAELREKRRAKHRKAGLLRAGKHRKDHVEHVNKYDALRAQAAVNAVARRHLDAIAKENA